MQIIVTKTYVYDFRPGKASSLTLEPSDDPQTVKKSIGEAAIAAGHAAAYESKRGKSETTAQPETAS